MPNRLLGMAHAMRTVPGQSDEKIAGASAPAVVTEPGDVDRKGNGIIDKSGQ
jgi:hypothetical protein